MAYTLSVLTESIKHGRTKRSKAKARGKLIIESTEQRPQFIEINNLKKLEEPIIRIVFSNDELWIGSFDELKKKLILSN